jgi:hypothetical protein
MANLNLNLVLANLCVVNATKLGCDAVAQTSGRGMPPTLSQWQCVLPRFTYSEPSYSPTEYKEPAKRIKRSDVNRPGSQVILQERTATLQDRMSLSGITQLAILSDKGLSERGEQHRHQHDHDYPSQDRHDVMQHRGSGLQTTVGSVFNTGKRK